METTYSPNHQAGTVELAPGLTLWRELTVRGADYKGYDVEVVVVIEEGRLMASAVSVQRRPGGPPVTGEALRHVTVAAFVRHAIAASSHLQPDSTGQEWEAEPGRLVFGLLEPAHRDRMLEAGPVTETLEWVARIYVLALATGDKPTKAVEDVFGVPRYTASRWVASARKRGLLAPVETAA